MYNLIEKKDDQLFFSPGDTVVLKQALTNKPVMVVKTIDRVADVGDKPKLVGVTCMWFSTNQVLQTHRFSTKDLEKHDEQPNR